MSQPLAPTVYVRVLLMEWTMSARIVEMVESKDGVSSAAGLKCGSEAPCVSSWYVIRVTESEGVLREFM